jgi:hypothetical protein
MYPRDAECTLARMRKKIYCLTDKTNRIPRQLVDSIGQKCGAFVPTGWMGPTAGKTALPRSRSSRGRSEKDRSNLQRSSSNLRCRVTRIKPVLPRPNSFELSIAPYNSALLRLVRRFESLSVRHVKHVNSQHLGDNPALQSRFRRTAERGRHDQERADPPNQLAVQSVAAGR